MLIIMNINQPGSIKRPGHKVPSSHSRREQASEFGGGAGGDSAQSGPRGTDLGFLATSAVFWEQSVTSEALPGSEPHGHPAGRWATLEGIAMERRSSRALGVPSPC